MLADLLGTNDREEVQLLNAWYGTRVVTYLRDVPEQDAGDHWGACHFDRASLSHRRKRKVREVKNLKWVIESDYAISDDDIEFFLFATLFLLPPALINKVLDKLQKKLFFWLFPILYIKFIFYK